MMKRIAIFMLLILVSFALVSCQTTPTETTISTQPETDDFNYSSLTFPNYSQINPVRYLSQNEIGFYNGWQDFGLSGEIKTHPWHQATYTYQMYSYFIRTNLQDLYGEVLLPQSFEDLPQWVAQTEADGHRILWFSMTGRTLPNQIELLQTEVLANTSETQTFIRAEYRVTLSETIQQWIVYFMEVDGIYSSYSIRVNEFYDQVLSTGDLIVKTYQIRTNITT